MEFVTIKKGNEKIKVEKGAVSIYAMRGWVVDNGNNNATQSTATAQSTYNSMLR